MSETTTHIGGMWRPTRGRRGAALTIAIVFGVIASVASYTLLTIATSQARQGRFFRNRAGARAVSDAAIIWAQQNLYDNPTWAGGPLTLNGYTAVVTVTPVCGAAIQGEGASAT